MLKTYVWNSAKSLGQANGSHENVVTGYEIIDSHGNESVWT